MPTTKVADPTAVANRLRPALLRANRALRREVHSLGVTGGEVALLSLIRAEPGIGVRELATRERMSPAAMSKHIARLENAGLLRRTALPDRRREPGEPASFEREAHNDAPFTAPFERVSAPFERILANERRACASFRRAPPPFRRAPPPFARLRDHEAR